MENQIKSKKRVAKFGEVYTAKQQVMDMVDMVNSAASEINTTVLEPACGNGNFLAEVLERKQKVIAAYPLSQQERECETLKAVSSIYGVDIQRDNVVECRERLYQQVVNVHSWPSQFCKMVRNILERNIVCGDTLTMMAEDGTPLVISEWDIRGNGLAVRKDVLFGDMVVNNGVSSNYVKRCHYRWRPEAAMLTA